MYLSILSAIRIYQTCEQHQSQCSFNFAHGRAEYASKRLHKNHVHFANHWRAWADFTTLDPKGSDGYDMIWPYTTVTIVTPEILSEKLGETWWNQRVVMVYPSLSVYPQFHKCRSCADPICIRQLTISPSSPNAVWNNHCSSKKFVIHVIHYSRFKCLPGKVTRSCCSETAHRWGQSASAPFHRRIALWLLLPRHELAGSGTFCRSGFADFPVENGSSACGHFLQNTYNPRADLPMIWSQNADHLPQVFQCS